VGTRSSLTTASRVGRACGTSEPERVSGQESGACCARHGDEFISGFDSTSGEPGERWVICCVDNDMVDRVPEDVNRSYL
jgi:hypothetical protein